MGPQQPNWWLYRYCRKIHQNDDDLLRKLASDHSVLMSQHLNREFLFACLRNLSWGTNPEPGSWKLFWSRKNSYKWTCSRVELHIGSYRAINFSQASHSSGNKQKGSSNDRHKQKPSPTWASTYNKMSKIEPANIIWWWSRRYPNGNFFAVLFAIAPFALKIIRTIYDLFLPRPQRNKVVYFIIGSRVCGLWPKRCEWWFSREPASRQYSSCEYPIASAVTIGHPGDGWCL